MNGESHTLRLVASNGELRLEMASANFRAIKATVQAAEAEAQRTGKADLARALGRLLRRNIETFEQFCSSQYDAIVLPAHPEHQTAAARERRDFNQILQAAVDLGTQHGIKSLTDLGHPSSFVLNDEIRQEHRAVWRETFYRRTWSSAISSTWRNSEFARLNSEALTDPQWATNPHVTDPSKHSRVFVVRDRNGQYPAIPYLDLATPANVHIDHIETVSEHFQTRGNAMQQAPRETWYELQRNLQLLNEHENTRKGGPRVTSWRVTSAFRGPGEQ